MVSSFLPVTDWAGKVARVKEREGRWLKPCVKRANNPNSVNFWRALQSVNGWPCKPLSLSFTRVWAMCACMLSHVQFYTTLWTVACQAPLSTGCSKNTGVDCHTLFQVIFPTQGSIPSVLLPPALAGGFFTTSATREAHLTHDSSPTQCFWKLFASCCCCAKFECFTKYSSCTFLMLLNKQSLI